MLSKIRRFRRHPLHVVRSQKGIALLVAMFALVLMTFLAMQLAYESDVEYVSASQGVKRLQAYYAADAAAQLGLLRILVYKQALATFGKQLGSSASMLDPIWKFPFAWPPSQFLGQNKDTTISRVDVDMIKEIEKKSLMKAHYFLTIESEGAKIDINDLGSDSKTLAKATQTQILNIFARQMQNDQNFNQKYRDTDFQKIINNMADWVDADNDSRNGGSEKNYYPDIQSDFIPANQAFKTLDELHMVAGMNDELYNLLKPQITVYGAKGININYADEEYLKSLDPQMTDDVVKQVMQRRSDPDKGGPFTSKDDFLNYLKSLGVNTATFDKDLPMIFGPVYNFRITAVGEIGGVSQKITAVTYDFDQMRERYAGLLDADEKANGSANASTSAGQSSDGNKKSDDTGTATTDSQKQEQTPKGRPRVVYWFEN